MDNGSTKIIDDNIIKCFVHYCLLNRSDGRNGLKKILLYENAVPERIEYNYENVSGEAGKDVLMRRQKVYF